MRLTIRQAAVSGPLAGLLVMSLALLLPAMPAVASHIEASSIALTDSAAGATSTYTVSYQVGNGNGDLASGQPKLRIVFPTTTDVSGASFDSAASGICACPSGSLGGTFNAFPALAAGGAVTVDASARTVTIGPLATSSTAGSTAFRVVIDGVVNRTTVGMTSLTAEVLNAADATNTTGPIPFTLVGASATTGTATSIGATSATLAGSASAPVSVTITRRGIVVGTGASPTVGAAGVDTLDDAAPASGSYTVSASGLTPETVYVFRAFVEANGVITYGSDVNFTTGAVPPEPEDPRSEWIARAVVAQSGIVGDDSVLVRNGSVVATTTSRSATAGPRGGLLVEAPEGTLGVTVSSSAGLSEEGSVAVPQSGQVTCEVCAQLSPGAVIEAWLYSTPRLVAAVRVPIDYVPGVSPCPLLVVPTATPLDGGSAVEPGDHVLQLRIATLTGLDVLSIPLVVGGPMPAGVPAGEGIFLRSQTAVTALGVAAILLVALTAAVRSRRTSTASAAGRLPG